MHARLVNLHLQQTVYVEDPMTVAQTCRCVIDRRPRQFDAESCNLLCNFAEVVVREIEKEKLRVRSRGSLLCFQCHAFCSAVFVEWVSQFKSKLMLS